MTARSVLALSLLFILLQACGGGSDDADSGTDAGGDSGIGNGDAGMDGSTGDGGPGGVVTFSGNLQTSAGDDASMVNVSSLDRDGAVIDTVMTDASGDYEIEVNRNEVFFIFVEPTTDDMGLIRAFPAISADTDADPVGLPERQTFADDIAAILPMQPAYNEETANVAVSINRFDENDEPAHNGEGATIGANSDTPFQLEGRTGSTIPAVRDNPRTDEPIFFPNIGLPGATTISPTIVGSGSSSCVTRVLASATAVWPLRADTRTEAVVDCVP